MKQLLFAVTSLLILSSASYGQSKWWVSSDSVNIFTRNTGGVMIGGVEPLGKLTVNSDRLGFNLALVGDYNNLTKNYLKIGVLGRASNGLDGHTLFDLYHSNGTLKKAGFNFRINEKSAFFINGEGNIGIGTEKPLAGLDITSGPDWGGFRRGIRLSANNAISVESGEMKYGMVGSENALHFFATNGGDKVNPFGSAFAKLMSLQPKKVVIEGDLEVKGKIIYEGGQFTGGGSSTGGSNTGGTTTGTGTSDDGGKTDDGGKSDGVTGGGFVEGTGDIHWDGTYGGNIHYSGGNVGIGTTSPGAKLEINGGPTWIGSYNKSLTLNSNNALNFISASPQSSHFGIAGNSTSKKLDFFRPKWWQQEGEWTYQSLMTLDSNGNLNLGATGSTYKLDVNGTFRATSSAYFNDKVGIGTTSLDTFKLSVNGSVKAKAFLAIASGWADFVFADDYKLMPLHQLEKHVKANKHLPGIPTENEVIKNGVNVADVQVKLLQKVEELTLYLIEQNKKIEAQQKDIEQLKAENKELKLTLKKQR